MLYRWILLPLLFLPTIVLAHPNHAISEGFLAGFLHPITGLDHVLAMTAVGVIAFQKGGKWLWMLPLCFLSFMILGGLLGMGGTAITWFEVGISLSVIILGLCITFPHVIPRSLLLLLVMAFAVCHGYAHGVEMQSGFAAEIYGIGFVGMTALLHLLGIGGSKITYTRIPNIIRLSGLGMAISVFWL